MDQLNIRVLIKEPRGFIRLLQILFSLLAWSTTARFSTQSKLSVVCPVDTLGPQDVDYNISYPFDLSQTELLAPEDCVNDVHLVPILLPIDFASTAMLYVLVCIISLLYSLGAAAFYCLFTAKYENDPLTPMVDLCFTLLLAIFWVLITCTWALNISDLKHYTNPHTFMKSLNVCTSDANIKCEPGIPGKWTSLTVSIVCGFTCVVLWFGSTWFIFKETTLHKKQAYQQTSTNLQQQQQQQQPQVIMQQNYNQQTGI